MNPQSIGRMTDDHISEIREYVAAQQRQWRFVPELALQADVHAGRENHQEMWRDGQYTIPTYGALPDMVINLSSGELFSAGELGDAFKLGLLDVVIRSSEALFAGNVITRLAQSIGYDSGLPMETIVRNAQWGNQMRQEHLMPRGFPTELDRTVEQSYAAELSSKPNL